MSNDSEAPAVETSRFRELHPRTFELELLFSAAFFLGLLQLPGPLLGLLDLARYHLAGDVLQLAIYVYIYLAFALYALIGAFLIHIICRGLWIALVGLESVYPEGIYWDNLNLGPTFRRVLEPKVPRLSRAIERLDDLSSLIFAIAATLILTIIFTLLMVLVLGGIGLIASTLFGRQVGQILAFTIFALLALFQVLLLRFDRSRGAGIAPDSRAGYWLERAVRFSSLTSVLPLAATPALLLRSRFKARRVTTFFLTSLFILTLAVLAPIVLRSVNLLESQPLLDDSSGVDSLPAEHYRDRPNRPEVFSPSIQSEIIGGPYIKLFLPYRPDRQDQALAATCPTSTLDEKRRRWAIDCLVKLYQIRLDGQEPTDLRFDLWESENSEKGIVAHLATQALTPGRHELTIDELFERKGRSERSRWVIPFWR